MLQSLLQLIILFTVIFDPFASLFVFLTASANMSRDERKTTATYAILVAFGLSLGVIMFGEYLLMLFSTTIDQFRVAGGIILAILGIKMALGLSVISNPESVKNNSGRAIAAIIGTPLLTGPAAITAIIFSVNDYGRFLTLIAVTIVLAGTTGLFYNIDQVNKFIGKTAIQIMTTILGLVTIAWGVKFITEGLKAIFHIA
ncbi:MarC family protein [Candidatus Woesearchaeota archaeon]|nr:MarC family protein [Candidatus Woesearchaeota archaeon]